MSESWTLLKTLKWTTEYFASRGASTPRLDAELLLADVLGIPRLQLYVDFGRPLEAHERAAYRDVVRRRARGEPVQYIRGRQEFWSIDFAVEPGVLVPRADTEVLVEEALTEAARLQSEGSDTLLIADVGTGSGCIAVALAHELKHARVLCGDIAEVPLRVAPHNAGQAGVADRVDVLQADGLMPLHRAAGQPFDLVVSNPPYIRKADFEGLMREVREHEPYEALIGGESGLGVILPLIEAASDPNVLRPGGALLLEIADGAQAAEVAQRLVSVGWECVRTRDDYGGRPRVVVGRRPTM